MAIETITPPPTSNITEIITLGRPLVIGHAGGDQSWPHSTMFGFTEAALAGVDVLEMDVQLTADGVLVVQHDDSIDRTTESTGRVRDLTLVELQTLDNAYWWSDDWSNHGLADTAYVFRGIRTGDQAPPSGYDVDDFRIESFRTVAEAFPDHALDVEIKVPSGADGEPDLEFAIAGARVLAEEIAQLGRSDSVVVVSFNDDVMAAFHELAPGVITSPGTTATFSWLVGSADLHPLDLILQLPPQFQGVEVLSELLLTKAADDGLTIWAWPNDAATQENADFYAELLDLGIGGVLAGHPEEAIARFRADGDIP